MSGRMYIKAIKLTKDEKSIKIVYEKNGKHYIRSGKDGFKRGIALQVKVSTLLNTWGFRKVDNAPYFYDGSEIQENINRFALNNKGEIYYSG